MSVCATLEMADAPYLDLTGYYRKAFRVPDSAALDVCLATVATATVPGDPLWAFIVAPPSSGKTETLTPFDVKELPTHFLSSLTPNTLISGLPGGHDLLPELDEKTLIIKDATTILTMPRDRRNEIFGQLRDAYDGTYSKAFGTYVGEKRYDSHFNLLAAVTNAIEDYYTVMSILGNRYLLVRMEFPKDFLMDGERDIQAIRNDLKGLALASLKGCETEPLPKLPDSFIPEIKGLAGEVAVLRTHVSRDRNLHHVTSSPDPEGPYRLANQFRKLACGLAKVRGHETVEKVDMQIVRRVARDTVPSMRRNTIEALRLGSETIAEVADALGLSHSGAERHLEDLTLLGVVETDNSGTAKRYQMAREITIL